MNKSLITILSFSSFYIPGYKGGGPIKTIKNLVDSTQSDFLFKILTSNHDLNEKTIYPNVISGEWNNIGSSKVFYTNKGIKGLWEIFKIIIKEKYDIIYLNSFFSFRYSIFPFLISKLLRKKIIVAPRGEFSEGALELKKEKKKAFLLFYKTLRLYKNITFQASTHHEKFDIKNTLNANVKIKIAGNIGSHEFAQNISKRNLDKGVKTVFLSRISPKKNLLGALNILSDVKLPLTYHIYGPIEDKKYWSICIEEIKKLPKNIEVIYKGELQPSEVISTLSKYDLFFMPTLGENYGHVIAEALCAGLPILIADTTPWRNLQNLGLGWDISLSNPEEFVGAIESISTMTIDELFQKKVHILNWAKNKFSQDNAVKENIKMFKYIYEKKS